MTSSPDVLHTQVVTVAATWSSVTDWLLGPGIRIVIVIVIGVSIRWLLHRAISRLTRVALDDRVTRFVGGSRGPEAAAAATGVTHERHEQRVRTTSTMLRSTTTVVVGAITVLTVLGIVGVPLSPILASAGVGGVALGFGAQSLVKDYLSGIVMIIEDQYGVGDVVDAGLATGANVTGTVEDVSLRVTRVRDSNGVAWYIPNGQFVRVGNTTQGWSTAIVDTPIAYTESIEQAITVIREAATSLESDPAWSDRLIDAPQVAGVESVGGATVTIRTTCKCLPQQNFPVQRELRERIKAALDRAGIKGPPPAPFAAPGG